MAIVTLPTFADLEIVTAEKLNALVAALNAKFSGGFDSGDIQWPLTAEGDLRMDIYDITGGHKIMNVINAANYPFEEAVAAAGAGGCVFIPPNTTVTGAGVTFTGNGVAIVGAGPSSVLRLAGEAPTSTFILRSSGATAHTGFLMANLTLDGNASAGTGNTGLQLRYVHNAVIHGVTFQNFSGPALDLTYGVAAGNGCSRVSVSNCVFSGGSSYHILSNDVSDITIHGNTFVDNTLSAIYLKANATNCLIKRVKISNNNISSGINPAIFVEGNATATSANWADIDVSHNTVDSMTGASPAIYVGSIAGGILRASVCDNSAVSAAHDGLSVCCDYGTVRGNLLYSAGGDGIDLTESVMLEVSGNDVRTATANGIDAHDSVSCTIHDNRTQGSAVPLLHSATTRQWANGDTVGALPFVGFVNRTAVTVGAGLSVAGGFITIPANTLRVGDVLHFHSAYTYNGDADYSWNMNLVVLPAGGTASVIAQHAWDTEQDALTDMLDATMVVTSATAAYSLVEVNSQRAVVINTAVDMRFYVTSEGDMKDSDSMTVHYLEITRIGGYEEQTAVT